MSYMIEIISNGPEETQEVGRVLGGVAQPGDVFLLVGELGSGKTCLTQGIAWGLGVKEQARSPTFVLVNQYQGRLMVYHVDLYRLDSVDEIWDLGLDEYLFSDGVCVIEWAEKAPEVFPQQHLLVQIEYLDETQRRLTIKAKGDAGRRLADRVRETFKQKV